jgi:hypothetical protein
MKATARLCYCARITNIEGGIAADCEAHMVDERKAEASMDASALYQEEVFTDRKVGMIRRMTPMTADGLRDPARKVLYVGQAEIMTNMGPMPINFEIEAENFAQAIAGFGVAATAAVERTVQQIQEMRRQAASQLVVPGAGMGGGGLPGGLPGVPGGRGKIQMP